MYKIPLAVLLAAMFLAVASLGGDPSQPPAKQQAEPANVPADDAAAARNFRTERVRGQVVWMADAMTRRFGVATDADVERTLVALETTAGELLPLVKDARGRGFLIDERLREIPLELLVRRFDGSPMIQVIRVYTIHDDQVFEFDYWCDICAIPMFELKECECCQGPIRFRERDPESGAERVAGD